MTVEAVQEAVRHLGCTPHLIRPSLLPTNGRFLLSEDRPTVWGDDGEEVDCRSLAGIWHWHPSPPAPPDTDPSRHEYVRQEWKLALAGLKSVTRSAIWMNDPDCSSPIDGNKLRQYTLARLAGMQVPSTLLTNDPDAIRRAAAKWGAVAIKAQGGVQLRLADGSYASTFTQRCVEGDLVGQDQAIRRTPVLVQPYLEKAWEARVTVIDETVVACRIDSQSNSRTAVDWRRYATPHVEHRLVDLEPGVEQSIRRLMASAGLRYAAIDLLATPDGCLYFLDLNPSGQFGWIEGLTGAPITQYIATALVAL